ncbi:phytanoyl-CoA dioxygenase family protein [Prauserella cavernicola]|uniref:Phytanoyl-CoA dioxygenase family protein n=1 Tax=Prauserella cavernicola TaxID=2800127 RepID=A0A934QX57_9PSEU|nr:phytanoyl-CoA dioxygenase family protein [Prauserella cavernicola]MBK1787985.1 phytanoyl-CoA dioxygenase family protein [Prauserella cavernicola]
MQAENAAVLPDDAIRSFRENGFLFPLEILGEHEVATLADHVGHHLADSRAEGDVQAALAYGPKIHLLRPWAAELVRHPRLIAVATSLLGPDVLVWSSNIFVKEPGGESDLAWHQDALSYDLAGAMDRAFRVWLTLTPATAENGTMRFACGTHRLGVLQHRRGATEAELMRGDEVCLDLDEFTKHDVVLRAGQCSLHNMLIVHGSGLNKTSDARVSIAIDYLAPSVRPSGDNPDSALLVSGRDRYGHFLPEHSARPGFDEASRAEFERAVEIRFARIGSAMRAGQAAGVIVSSGS